MNKFFFFTLFILLASCKTVSVVEPVVDRIVTFPINIVYDHYVSSKNISQNIAYANKHLEKANIRLELGTVKQDSLPEMYEAYRKVYTTEEWVAKSSDTLTLWIASEDENNMCRSNGGYTTCTRISGFTIRGGYLNKVFFSNLGFSNKYVFVHELGHYFGLLHTFETMFGKELPDGSNGATTGDKILDTPADPYYMYEGTHVANGACEMFFKDWKPMINNFMSYYRPCLLKDYAFTEGQYQLMRDTAPFVTVRKK